MIYFNSFVLSATCLDLLAFLLFIDMFVVKRGNHVSMNHFIHSTESLLYIVLETATLVLRYYLKTILDEVHNILERTDIVCTVHSRPDTCNG